jgi:hyperosmotically inducible protein
MNYIDRKFRVAARGVTLIAMFTFLVVSPQQLEAATRFTWQEIQQPDNSKNNQDRSSPTADQQKSNASDQAITRGIRKSIMSDKSLSTYAHNVKIITQNGKVTLRGPVRSDEEKANIESKAAVVAGQENVTSRIEVAPGK